jgi:Fe-S cluster assembly protein SufD
MEDLPAGARLISLDGAANDAPALIKDRLGSVAGPGGDGLMALNTAFMTTGGVLHVDDGVALDAPVQLLFLATGASAGAAVHPRNLIVLGAGASATVVETYAGADDTASWTNGVTEIVVGQGARLEHFKLQQEGDAAWHTALVRVRLLQDADYRAFVMSAGARLARNECRVRLEGRGAACRLEGATLLRGRQHADNTTEVVHAALDGTSRQTFKGVLDGASRSVFQGRVLVEAGAQRTDAHQINRNLLLSPGAEADSKPELVIHADDVKCSHGATTGELDREALFYMRARGIDPAAARALLIEAFMVELIEGVTLPAVQAQLAACLDGWLGRAAIGKAAA